MSQTKDIDNYISSFPAETQKVLEQIRSIIRKAAPKAEEVISYKMPAYKQEGGILVYFAGYKSHVGLYPTASGIKAFEKEFENYKWSKGAVQFPLDKRLPVTLITKIVKFRLAEVKEKAVSKKK